jgi:plasmid maintenance system killer protein
MTQPKPASSSTRTVGPRGAVTKAPTEEELENLAELWEKGSTAKIVTKMQARILRRLDRLDVIVRPEEMNLPGFDFHPLRGFRPTRYLVHVNVVHHV